MVFGVHIYAIPKTGCCIAKFVSQTIIFGVLTTAIRTRKIYSSKIVSSEMLIENHLANDHIHKLFFIAAGYWSRSDKYWRSAVWHYSGSYLLGQHSPVCLANHQ